MGINTCIGYIRLICYSCCYGRMSEPCSLIYVHEHVKKEFLDFLSNPENRAGRAPGTNKVVYYEKSSISKYDEVLGISKPVLEKHGVSKMYHLDPHVTLADHKADMIIFIVAATETSTTQVVKCLSFNKTFLTPLVKEDKIALHVMFLPHRSFACEKLFDQAGVRNLVRPFASAACDFALLAPDLLSMNYELAFREAVIQGERISLLHHLTDSLRTVMQAIGLINTVTTIGPLSAQSLKKLRQKLSSGNASSGERLVDGLPLSSINEMVLIDRTVDLLTPFLVPVSYEAVLDEYFGITAGAVTRPTSEKATKLTQQDEVFAEIRDVDTRKATDVISKKLRLIQEAKSRVKDLTVSESRTFVETELSIHKDRKQSIEQHIPLVEELLAYLSSPTFLDSQSATSDYLNGLNKSADFVEQCISRTEDVTLSLRLLAIRCLCSGGFRQKQLAAYRRAFLNSYGYHQADALQKLESLNIIAEPTRQPTGVWSQLASSLLPEGRSDVTAVYSGYMPRLVKAVQMAVEYRGRTEDDLMRLVAGGELPVRSVLVDRSSKQTTRPRRNSDSSIQSDKKQVVLVCVIGGLTRGEMSVFRRLNLRPETTTEYLVCTTNILTTKKFCANFLS